MSGPVAAEQVPVVDVHDAFCVHQVPDGAVAALRGLSLRVAPGERVVVHGPNGSGKTTLLRVLAGEQPLTAGRAVVAGAQVGSLAAVGRRARRADAERALWRATRLGWVDQHPARTLRPELDVLDNVALQQQLAGVPAQHARARARDLLGRLGVEHLVGRRPGTLSGGEAQRVAVCAALAHGPSLVLADEPTGELDHEAAADVYDALAAAVAAAGAALVLVSHDRAAARVADRVVRIRDGRLSETWTPGGAESLVVDERGWLRLPDAVRRAAGSPDTVSVALGAGGIELRGSAGASSGSVAAQRVAAVVGPEAVPGGPVAALAGVTKAYAGRPVLRGADLAVEPGRLVVVRGRSGAGKSTLLRVLLGLERPDAGSVTLDGADLTALDRGGLAKVRRRCCAVSGQDVHLAETLDAAANLALARAVRGLPEDAALVAATLDALGLTPLLGREVRLLSGGERQRVAVARALVVRPRLAVLDEPTSQLDEASTQALVAVLVAQARAGTALVVTSHDPEVVAAADVVVDLETGPRAVAVGRDG